MHTSIVSKALGAGVVAAVLALAGTGTAVAASHGSSHCKVISVVRTVEARDITGVKTGPTTYGRGVQYRTKTATTERCRGKVSTAVTYTAWA